MGPFQFKHILRGIAAALILAAVGLLIVQWQRSAQQITRFPAGSRMANIPVGGLTHQEAEDRLKEAYARPVTIRYHGYTFLADPQALGFQLDSAAILQNAERQLNRASFWNSLWKQAQPRPVTSDLAASVDEAALRSYLTTQVAARFDQPPSAPVPLVGTTRFQPGQPGLVLNVDAAVAPIQQALRSPDQRSADLPVEETPAPPLDERNLQILLQQIIDHSGFPGLTELYVQNLKSGKVVHFARSQGQEVQPDIAFTAASTIKIAIMTSVLSRTAEPTPPEVTDLLERMIVLSENPPADTLMDSIIAKDLGPLEVTRDMQKLGLKNTFLAGYFYLGAPLLQKYETPANLRSDINLSPDIYNQTTPAEMSTLLADLYHCAQDGSGPIQAAFGGQVSQSECALTLDYLQRNKNGLLIEAGLPEGTRIAHKHGWIEETDGLLHTMSDTGIIYTPGGDYVLTIYVYNRDQLVFDPANRLMARLSETVYNAFNLDQQVSNLYGRIDE